MIRLSTENDESECFGSAHMTRHFSARLSLLSTPSDGFGGCVLQAANSLVEWFLCPDGFREAPLPMQSAEALKFSTALAFALCSITLFC